MSAGLLTDPAVTLLRITLPYACFGVELDPLGRVVRAAPIGKWMLGKHRSVVRAWVLRKGGSVEEVAQADEPSCR
jgi:hypothetical protein